MRCPFCHSVIDPTSFGNIPEKTPRVKCDNCKTIVPYHNLSHPHANSVGNHSQYLVGDPAPNAITTTITAEV